jgi:uncharacterized protein with GYD domain
MLQAAYTQEAWAALTKHPTNRTEAIGTLAQQLGGKLVGLYYCYGKYDGIALLEVPDDTTATAIVLATITAGHIKATKTTKLFTPEEMMEAMRKAGGASYQAPSEAAGSRPT